VSGAAPLAEALEGHKPLVRQLREIKGVSEARPGVLLLRGKPFVTFVVAGEDLVADLLKPGGSGVDRMPLGSPPQQRKLVDEAKLRAKRLDDAD
jgi:hypothetical protein